jgi:hypothetical protein
LAAVRLPEVVPARAPVQVAPVKPPAEVAPDEAPAEDPPELVIVSTSKETPVYSRPSSKSPKIGYLRAGAVVSRHADPAGYDGCRGGFYEVTPEGYVCVGNGASLDARHDLARAVPRRADRTAPMPYVYGLAKAAGAPLYARLPTGDEQRDTESDVDAHRAHAGTDSFEGMLFDEVPWFLQGGGASISTNGYRYSHRGPVLGAAIARTGFAFVSLFESGGRRFGLTVDMAVVPLDRFTRIEPSRFHGLPLLDSTTLPVVFVRSRSAVLYAGDPKATGLRFDRRLEFREAVPITSERAQVGRTTYLRTQSGGWIADQSLVRVDPAPSAPPWATPGRTWIDISIDKQALVAYEGTRPVFVTLVSTGADGTGDPETTHSTVQGQFLIHTKHVTVTMDGDDVGDEFDLRDVPYVQYFKDGYALHAAYWHDGFGGPRSHGCVNLSPLDARWVFAWTLPPVPTAWHGAMSALGKGTLVSIHP